MVSNYAHFCSNLRHMHWYVVCAPTLLGGIAAILTFRWNLQARRAMPMSALLRSQTVFLLLGCGLSGGFQTLRPLSQGGCGVDDKYLVFGAVPMLAGARFPTIPEWSFRFASSLEAYLTGITVLSLLLVEPRLRQAFNPLWEKRVRSTWMEVVLSWSAGVFFTVGYPLWNLWFLASLPPMDQEESEGPSVRFANYEDKNWSYFFWTLGDIAGFLFGLVLALLARRRERDMLAYLTPPGRKPKSTELVGARVEVGTPPLPESSSTEASERSSSCFWSWCFCSCRRRTPLFPVFAAARNPVFIAFIGLRTFRLFGALYVVDVTTAEYLNGFAAQLICCIAMFRYADAARPLRDPVLWLSMQQQDAEQQDAQTEVNPASASDSCLVALLRDTWLHRIWSCLTSLLVDSMRMVVLFPVLTLLPSIHTDVKVFRQLLQRMGLNDITSDKTLLIELLSLVPKKEIEKGRRAWSDWQLMLSHKETSLTIGFSWPAGQADSLSWTPSSRCRRCWLSPLSWAWVAGDVFSDRLRTPDVTALFFTFFLVFQLHSGILYRIMDTTRCDVDVERPEKVPCPEGLPPGISGVLSLLTAIFRLLTGWLGLAIAMFGNNVLWNRKFSRVWYALVCVGSGLYLFVGPIDILLAIDTVGLPDATVIWPQPSWIEMFSYLGLFYWLFESAARVLFSPCGARNSATYRIETMARLYCRELLKGHESSGRSSWAADEYYEETIVPTLPEQSELVLKITRNKRLKSGRLEEVTRMVTGEELHGKYSDHGVELRPGQIHDVNFSGDSRPCLVREVFADGTCTLVTEAGKMLHGVLAKQLTPSKVTDRAIDKSSFSAVLRRAAGHLGSAVDRARFEVDKQTHKVRQSVHSKLRKGPPAAESQPEGGGWAGVPREGAQDELPRPGPSSASSRGIFDAGEEMDLDEESKRCLEKCRAGNNYQRSVDWSNVRRRKLRELFSTSVGYPVLVLAAIYGSALCVVMTSLSMAMKTTQLSRAVEVNRLKAVGALRITTGGLLCDSDEAAWAQTWRGGSYERCVSLNGDPAMCMTHGPLLFDAHDHDLNSELDDTEVLELVHMVHDVLLVRVAEDRSAVALLENEILDIAVQVKSSRVSAAAAWNGSANGTANSTVESIECADDDAAAVAGAAAAGFTVSGCQDLVTVCEDEAVGTDVHRMCPETCGACGSNGTESSSLELGCVDNNDAFRVAMAAQGYDITGCPDVREWCEDAEGGEWIRYYCPDTCGVCHWNREDTSMFVCNVSQAIAAKEEAGGGFSESVAPLFIFTLLDQPPKDGYLTREELQQLAPLLAMAGPELAPTFQQLLDRGFALADSDPRDQRLSQAEAGKLISDLQKMIPRLRRLFSAIVCVAAGAECDEALTGELLLDVLDLDGDGRVSKAEVNTYVVVLEVATGSPHLGPVGNDFVRAADANGDGYLDEAELDEVAYRTTVLLNVMRDPSPENLKALLDRDGDGQVSPEELDGIVDVMPCSTSTAMSGVEAGSTAAVGPTPAPMGEEELGVFSTTVGEATPQCALDAGLAARRLRPSPEGHGRPAPEARAPPAGRAAEARRLTEGWASGSAWEEVTTQLAALLDSLFRIAKTDEFRIVAPLVILGTRVSIIGGLFLAINSIYQTTKAFDSMVQKIQGGDKSYSAAGLRNHFRGSFSVSAAFPGCLIVLTLLAFFVGTCMTFVIVVSLVTPVVLFFIETTKPLILRLLETYVYPFLTVFAVKFVLKSVVVDKLLIKDGEIRAPPIFAPLWYVLVMLNIVWAAFTVPARFVFSVFGALYTSTLMHHTVLPEKAVKALDPCYAAFLAMAFTQSNRRNLVRRCFLTLLIPYLHVAFPPAPPTRGEVEQSARRKRIRNKFWVLVTLFNNPELKQYRRRTLQQELDNLKVLSEEPLRAPSAPEEEPGPRPGPCKSAVTQDIGHVGVREGSEAEPGVVSL